MYTSTPIADGDSVDLLTLRRLAQRDAGRPLFVGNIVVLAGITIYAVATWATESVLVAIVGGVLVLALRTMGIQRVITERLVLMSDLMVEMDRRHCERIGQLHDVIETEASALRIDLEQDEFDDVD